jgi:hypothetical protein
MSFQVNGVTRTYYETDALRHGYQGRVTQRLKYLLEHIEWGTNLGHYISEWYPDPDTRVRYMIQPGITGQMIDVKVTHTKRDGGGEKKTRKESSEPRPYLWVGIAAVNHQATLTNETFGTPFHGNSVMPMVYAYEPEPEDGYTWWESLEVCEGCYQVFGCLAEVWPARLAGDVGAAADGAGLPERWIDFGDAPLTYSDDLTSFGNVAEALMCLDYLTVTGPGNAQVLHATVKITRHKMVLAGMVATQVLAPAAAYDDEHDLTYWQYSVIVDPSGVRPTRREFASKYRLFNDVGVNFDFKWNEETTILSTALGGLYRIDIAAAALECDGVSADIKVRVIQGSGAGLQKQTGDPEGELESDGNPPGLAITVTDYDCSGIGSEPNETVLNIWYARSFVLGGAHDWSNGPPGFGPMPADAGFWNTSIMIDVKNNTHSLEPFNPDFPPYYGGGEDIRFNPCFCEDEQGGPPEGGWAGPVTGIMDMNLHVRNLGSQLRDKSGQLIPPGGIAWNNPAAGLFWQLAIIDWTCDGNIETVRIIHPRSCPQVPGFAEGATFRAVGIELTQGFGVGAPFILGSPIETGWSVGELVIVVNLNIFFLDEVLLGYKVFSGLLYVARPLPIMLGNSWQAFHACPNGQVWGTANDGSGSGFKSDVWYDSRANLIPTLTRIGYQWTPSPIPMHYDYVARGFVME